MSSEKQFLLIYVKDARPGPLMQSLCAGLRERGAGVTEMQLAENHEALLDALSAGAVPLVIRQTV